MKDAIIAVETGGAGRKEAAAPDFPLLALTGMLN